MIPTTRPARLLATLALAGAAALALAGCTSASTASTRPTVTETETAGAAPAVPSPTTASPASSVPAGAGSGAHTGSCSTGELTARIGEQDGRPAGSGSGMDQEHVSVILTNTGPVACTIQGWPGVSFVGGGDGAQIGASAVLTRGVPNPTVTLHHGDSAQAYLTVVAAAAFPPGDCHSVRPDGFRVYPPGSTTSLFIRGAGAGTGEVCANAKDGLLKVDAVVPYP